MLSCVARIVSWWIIRKVHKRKSYSRGSGIQDCRSLSLSEELLNSCPPPSLSLPPRSGFSVFSVYPGSRNSVVSITRSRFHDASNTCVFTDNYKRLRDVTSGTRILQVCPEYSYNFKIKLSYFSTSEPYDDTVVPRKLFTTISSQRPPFVLFFLVHSIIHSTASVLRPAFFLPREVSARGW